MVFGFLLGCAVLKEMHKKKGQKTRNPFKGANLGVGKSKPSVSMPKGWRKDSARHSLARKGIKTGRKKKAKK